MNPNISKNHTYNIPPFQLDISNLSPQQHKQSTYTFSIPFQLLHVWYLLPLDLKLMVAIIIILAGVSYGYDLVDRQRKKGKNKAHPKKSINMSKFF